MDDLSDLRRGDRDQQALESKPNDRRRAEIDELLSIAENLQDSLERRSQQFLTSGLVLLLAVLAGFVSAVVVILLTDKPTSISVGTAILCFGGAIAGAWF